MTLPLGSSDALAIGAEIYASQQNGNLGFAMLQHVTIDIPLATINAQSTTVAFAIGSALPTNCRLVDAEINVVQVIGGGGITTCTASVQGGTDAAGSIIATGANVHAATGTFAPIGSNTYPSRSGQQLFMTLTAGGAALSAATTGHLQVNIFYFVAP